MKKVGRFLKPFLLIGLVLASALQAQAFTLGSSDPGQKGWADPAIVFHLNPANCPANIRDVITKAMDVWNGVPTSNVNLSIGNDSASTYAQLDAVTATDVPVIICDTNFGADSGIGGNGIAGVGLMRGTPTGGNVRYGYLLINVDTSTTGNVANADATFLSLVLAHEIGHVLGLGHSPDENALMYYNAGVKANLALAQDDIDGITYLYPRNEPSDKVMGCGLVKGIGAFGGGGDGRGGPGAMQLLVILACLLLPIPVALGLKKKQPMLTPR